MATFILVFGAGYRYGRRDLPFSSAADRREVVNRETPTEENIDFSMFWDVWQRLHKYHIDAAKIDNQKLVWGAVSGMVNAVGDPYTTFLTPKENQDFKEDLSGRFEGIGAQLNLKDQKIVVVAPLKGSPALASGIKPGDWIIKVDDQMTVNWSLNEAVSKIRGPKGTKVKLNILHENSQKPVDITITRDQIKVPSVEYWTKAPSQISEIQYGNNPLFKRNNPKIAYISLSRFGDNLSQDWAQAVKATSEHMKKGDVAGLVFDLRNNPGGYLDGSVFIASEFLKSGVVVTQQNSDGTKNVYSVNRPGTMLTIPLVVLINQGSASAAEIVAGALQDHKRAQIVGQTSFGKGSVQSPQDLKAGASLHITTGKWLTPQGEWISEKGIKPDVEVIVENYEASRDAQLSKAVELLLK